MVSEYSHYIEMSFAIYFREYIEQHPCTLERINICSKILLSIIIDSIYSL